LVAAQAPAHTIHWELKPAPTGIKPVPTIQVQPNQPTVKPVSPVAIDDSKNAEKQLKVPNDKKMSLRKLKMEKLQQKLQKKMNPTVKSPLLRKIKRNPEKLGKKKNLLN
jgi:hypothetical protein